jgi:hypothetical protein
MFIQQEVQILIGGVDSPIDLDDLRHNTNYGGQYDDAHPVIVTFWQVCNSFWCIASAFYSVYVHVRLSTRLSKSSVARFCVSLRAVADHHFCS